MEDYEASLQHRVRFAKSQVLIEVSTRLSLKAGESYIIMPSVVNAGETGEFYLSLYFNIPLHMADIRDVTGDPKFASRCKLLLVL